MLEELKAKTLEANLTLSLQGLAVMTWGNASGLDRDTGLVAIKPSGVEYSDLVTGDMVLVDLDGKVVEGSMNPSSDTPTHLVLYKAFPDIGGVTHTHSAYATMFAQAQRGIPCLGTTHADHFYGEVPVTRTMTSEEVATDYEANTGHVIVERFEGIKPIEMPAVLVANHGPFTWGESPQKATDNAIALESVAQMAMGALQINPDAPLAPKHLIEKHYLRKHGNNAYYGQST